MAQFLKDLLLNGYNGVKPIETIQKGNNLGQQVRDVVSAELDKDGPRVLFYKQLPTLYGSDLIRISTKGSVDPARTLAVTGARPNKRGFARFLGNLLGRSANRPSDTIFPADGVSPPVSRNGQPVNGDYTALQYAVEAGNNYIVSQEPAGKNALTGLIKGTPSDIARNAAGVATATAKKAIGNLAINTLTSRRLSVINKLKQDSASKKTQPDPETINSVKKKGSEYIRIFENATKTTVGIPKLIDVKQLGLKERDYLIEDKLLKERVFTDETLKDLVKLNTGNFLQYIRIKNEETNESLLFPATITDIQDNMTPEWTAFKYVGSPFNNYRYSGVERKMSFDFRVYYINETESPVMKSKLNLLRELVYPSKNLTTIPLSGTNYTPLVFKPNTIQLSVGGLYKDLKGFVSNLSITVPQDAPWGSSKPNFVEGENVVSTNVVYPTFVDVSFEMTIIENHVVSSNTITYQFDEVAVVEEIKPATVSSGNRDVNQIVRDYGY